MGFQIFNFEDNSNVSVVSRKGIFKVIQYDKDLSCTAEDAQTKFYMSQMNVKKRQLMITLNDESVNIQPGAMQWYVGDVHQTTGLKGIGDTIKKFFNAQVTGESTIKPQYVGTGVIVTEPSYKHYIIEDDYDSELRLGGKPIPTLQSIDVSDKVIYMNTFTKTLSSTIRMSYMVLPESLADEYYRRLSFYSCTVSNFEQYTLSRFIENGHFERHINRLRNYYLKKQNTILNAFQTSSLNNKIEIYNETTGVHFLMKIKSEKAEKDIINNAYSKGIKLSPLSQYYKNNEENKNIYVMNYSSLDSEKIELIVEKLKQCI